MSSKDFKYYDCFLKSGDDIESAYECANRCEKEVTIKGIKTKYNSNYDALAISALKGFKELFIQDNFLKYDDKMGP